jgi:hypothetical protein
MHYAIAADHPAVARLIEVSRSIAEDRRPMSCATSEEVAAMLVRAVAGAPDASGFDVVALDCEDNDIHLLLRRRSDGLLARTSYIEGEDLCDDIGVFELVDEQNRDQIVSRFDRWCQFNLEGEDEVAYRSFVDGMVQVEENEEHELTNDLLMITPTLETLEGIVGRVRTDALRNAITDALSTIKAATRPK